MRLAYRNLVGCLLFSDLSRSAGVIGLFVFSVCAPEWLPGRSAENPAQAWILGFTA